MFLGGVQDDDKKAVQAFVSLAGNRSNALKRNPKVSKLSFSVGRPVSPCLSLFLPVSPCLFLSLPLSLSVSLCCVGQSRRSKDAVMRGFAMCPPPAHAVSLKCGSLCYVAISPEYGGWNWLLTTRGVGRRPTRITAMITKILRFCGFETLRLEGNCSMTRLSGLAGLLVWVKLWLPWCLL